MDMKVLQFQNKKLAERIEQRKRAEEELHKRIEQLENRQRTDDAVLMIVNRYWNQVCVIDAFNPFSAIHNKWRLLTHLLMYFENSEYDQEIPQSQTADNPMAPPGRAAQPSRDTRKTN